MYNLDRLFPWKKVRISDMLMGSAVGLAGICLIGRRYASSRLPALRGKFIRPGTRE